jgi:hypothetical protein
MKLAMLGLSVLGLLAVTRAGQPPVIGPIRDFKVPEYYPPPNQNQLKWLLTGSNAVPQGTITRLLLDHVNLATFRANGARDLQFQAVSCLFDSTQRTVSSGERIKVQTADGRLLIEGTGFCWQSTNSSIIISNQVHTIIKRGPTPAASDKP